MSPTDLFLNFVDKERNVYELAELLEQNRHSPDTFIKNLTNPYIPDGDDLELNNNEIRCKKTNSVFSVKNNVIDFRKNSFAENDSGKNWEKMNEQFLNYHKSLSIYTLLNSTAGINYISLKSGIGEIKNAKIIDVGGGTGHTLCSFFLYPETLEYYLVDPNLRLLHDQFIKIYPKLSLLKMAHILAYSESLPFKSNFADIILSNSAIDHYKSYTDFIRESFRVLKPGGKIMIASHLDFANEADETKLKDKIFSSSVFERIARYVYYRKYHVGSDDHVHHFHNTEPIEKALVGAGFKIEQSEIFKRNFFITATKPAKS